MISYFFIALLVLSSLSENNKETNPIKVAENNKKDIDTTQIPATTMQSNTNVSNTNIAEIDSKNSSPVQTLGKDKLYRRDVQEFELVVRDNVKVPLTQNEYAALVSFAFNIGEGDKSKGTGFKGSSVLKLINNPNAKTPYNTLEEAWMAWGKTTIKKNGRRERVDSPGLKNRRAAEWELFSK